MARTTLKRKLGGEATWRAAAEQWNPSKQVTLNRSDILLLVFMLARKPPPPAPLASQEHRALFEAGSDPLAAVMSTSVQQTTAVDLTDPFSAMAVRGQSGGGSEEAADPLGLGQMGAQKAPAASHAAPPPGAAPLRPARRKKAQSARELRAGSDDAPP